MSKLYLDGVFDISNEDYHANGAINRSRLMEFKKSPLHYHYKYLTDHSMEPIKSTRDMDFGNLVHCLVLEPDKFHDNFVIQPEFNKRTNDGKFKYNQFLSGLSGKIAITNEDFELANSMKNAIISHEIAALLLANSKVEQSIFWTENVTKIQCKVRMDSWKNNLVIDLKTCASADYKSIQNSALKYGYFLQAGMTYLALKSLEIELMKFVLICVEKSAPFGVGIFVIENEALEFGVLEFKQLIYDFAECQTKNSWPFSNIQSLVVPKYAEQYFGVECDE